MSTRTDDRTKASESLSQAEAPSDTEELERKKLLLETQKLTHEIRELGDASRRARRTLLVSAGTAVMTAITTLIVALVGAYITVQVQRITHREKNSDSYASLMKSLGSPNIPARAGAVVGLTKFAVDDTDRSAQTITILATQLASEEDARVLRVLIPSIVSIGQPALDDIVRVNRAAYRNYVHDMRTLIGTHLNTVKYYSELPNGERGPVLISTAEMVFHEAERNITAKLSPDLLNDDEEQVLAMLGQGIHAEPPLHEVLYRVVARNDESFGLMDDLFLSSIKDDHIEEQKPNTPQLTEKISDRKPNTPQLIDKISNDTLALVNSAIVLNRLIRSLSGKLGQQDLRGVALITADLRGLSLKGVNLESSFIAGAAGGADFTGAHLQKADLSSLRFHNTNLSYATLTEASLPETGPADVAQYSYLSNTNFTGANWWDTTNMPLPAKGPYNSMAVHTVGVLFHSGGRTALMHCPAPEISSTSVQQNTPDKPKAEVSNTQKITVDRFSIMMCIYSPEEQGAAFQAMFPRERNQAQRNDWLKRAS